MTAVGIYSLYNVDNYPLLHWLDSKREIITPYVQMTSQWQRWNLFSPDPLRRVTYMSVEYRNGRNWVTIKEIDEYHLSWWQRAPELKIIRRMEEDGMTALQERYLHDICRTQHLPEGSLLRLQRRSMVIPNNETPQTTQWWNDWQPEWYYDQLVETACPKTA